MNFQAFYESSEELFSRKAEFYKWNDFGAEKSCLRFFKIKKKIIKIIQESFCAKLLQVFSFSQNFEIQFF